MRIGTAGGWTVYTRQNPKSFQKLLEVRVEISP